MTITSQNGGGIVSNNEDQSSSENNNQHLTSETSPNNNPNGQPSTWGVKVNKKYRQLRKSLKTCKHFEDNYFVLELNGQEGGSATHTTHNKHKVATYNPPSSDHDLEQKKAAVTVPYREQVQLMSEFSVAPIVEAEVTYWITLQQ